MPEISPGAAAAFQGDAEAPKPDIPTQPSTEAPPAHTVDYVQVLAEVYLRQEADKEARDIVREINDQAAIWQQATSYNQFIIGAGYGGFFAVWGVLASRLPAAHVLITGGLIGISLTVFVAWNIYQIVWGHIWQLQRSKIIAAHPAGAELRVQWDLMKNRQAASGVQLLRIWLFVFVIGVSTGLGGGALLTYDAFAQALQASLK